MGTHQSRHSKYSRSLDRARIAVQRERVIRKVARRAASFVGRGIRPSPLGDVE